MKVGIIGLPNCGKSSLFNLLTQARAPVGLYPFTTIDKNIGIVAVKDERLERLAQITNPQKKTPATIQFVDIAGLVKGASTGEGLGNKFLAHIREVNLMLHLVRVFDHPNIPHIYGSIDPRRDYEIVEYELFMADLEMIERRLDRIKKKVEAREEIEILERVKGLIVQGQKPDPAEIPLKILLELPLLVIKPEEVVLNFPSDGRVETNLKGYALSVGLEEEILDFPETEKRELRESLKLNPDGIEGLIEICFRRLDLIRFYTIKGEETRAWAIKRGTTALEAAGQIHSDLRDGFIRAEVVNVDELIAAGNFASAVKSGKAKVEGREYEVKDGDVLLIKFR
ncbi:MAG: redox-regulated ATPase YchF [candidate division WOR-3 bacterium]